MTHWPGHRQPIRIPKFLLNAWRTLVNVLALATIHHSCISREIATAYTWILISFSKNGYVNPNIFEMNQWVLVPVCSAVWVQHIIDKDTLTHFNVNSRGRIDMSDIGVLLTTNAIICHWHKTKPLNAGDITIRQIWVYQIRMILKFIFYGWRITLLGRQLQVSMYVYFFVILSLKKICIRKSFQQHGWCYSLHDIQLDYFQ